MLEALSGLGPFKYLLILILGAILTAVALSVLLKDDKKIQASDGTLFSSEAERESYEILLQKAGELYETTSGNTPKESKTGLQENFVKLLTSDGFKDPKTLIQYRQEFKKLVGLLEDTK